MGLGLGWRVDLLVVDVPVFISDKFQQSLSYEYVEVPQFQFIDRVVGFSVVSSDVYPQYKLCRRPARSYRCCSWTQLRRPLLYNDRCFGYDSAENCGSSTVAALGQGTDHVISVVCWGKDASQGQYWIVREMGYVRVAFGALNVQSQCSWAVVLNC